MPEEVVEATSSEPVIEEEAATTTAPLVVADGMFKGVELKETPPEDLTEVYVIGMQYTDVFTDGSKTYEFPGDPEIHAHIAEKNAPIPTHEGMTWVHSTGRYLYDTASGELEEGQYAVMRNGSIEAKYPPFVSSTSTVPVADSPEPAPAENDDTEPVGSATSTDTTTEPDEQTSSSTPSAVDTSEAETGETVTSESSGSSTTTELDVVEDNSTTEADTPTAVEESFSTSTSTP